MKKTNKISQIIFLITLTLSIAFLLYIVLQNPEQAQEVQEASQPRIIWYNEHMKPPAPDYSYLTAGNKVVETVEKAVEVVEEPETEWVSLGEFATSGYCKCERCCGRWAWYPTASGAVAEQGVTVGADWLTLPKGSVIYIEGFGERVVQDKPSRWIIAKYQGRILDVFYERHEDALAHGIQRVQVWLKQE